MTPCPKCGSVELRVHGSRVHVDFVKRWGWFGAIVPRVRPRALEVSCADCLYAFVIREHGVTAAPLQTAHEQLDTLRSKLPSAPSGKGPQPSDDGEPPARAFARPAPDPRVRRR